ncbi:MAG: hypothetical protein BZ151_10055 [Desulfobacca sp. 4484_104]|nr:MAG: hypothetical protein BZ151_10055 [Desulfobacca sp. 4484_104]
MVSRWPTLIVDGVHALESAWDGDMPEAMVMMVIRYSPNRDKLLFLHLYCSSIFWWQMEERISDFG